MAASPLKNAGVNPYLNIWQTSSTPHEDFYVYSSGSATFTTSPSGSAALITGSDWLRLTSNGANNNAVGIATNQPAFYFQAGRGEYGESYVHLVNQATNTANLAHGFCSTTSLGITDGAISLSATSALLLKLDGEDYFRAYSSNGSTNTSTLSTTLGPDGYYALRVDIFNFDATNASVSFSVNGYPLKDSTGLSIIHKVAYASALNMYGLVQTQAGSANAQNFDVDYATFAKNRLVSF